MNKLKQIFNNTKYSIEHPIYHPEETLGNHILLVCIKALLFTNNIDLILSAMFHDCCKGINGQWKETDQGKYWSNEDHPKQAAELIISNDDIRYFIKGMKGNIDTIYGICYYHMACKDKIIKKAKKVPFIDQFVILDDMIDRKTFSSKLGIYYLLYSKGSYNGNLTYVGQSPIQRYYKNKEFTITIDRFPFVYNISDIPKFFIKTKYKDLVPYLNELI